MSERPRGQMGGRNAGPANGGGVARGAGFAAAKGGALIVLAIVIGIVLLQVVDDGSSTNADSGDDAAAETTTTVAGDDDGSSTTVETTPAGEELTPAEVSLLVLNGGAPPGSAGTMSETLSAAGYTNQPSPPSDWPDREQSGNVVMCREGLDREAASLAVAAGAVVEPFAEPAPPGSDEVMCVVIVSS